MTRENSIVSLYETVWDANPKPLTPQLLDTILDSPQVQSDLHLYRTKADAEAKGRLPAITFNGLFMPELREQRRADTTLTEKQRKQSRCASDFLPSGLYGLDIDEKGRPEEIFSNACQQVRKQLGMEPEQIIAMAYITPGQGLRLVVRRAKGLTIQEEQQKWNTLLGTPCDAVCKDMGRLYYLTSRQDLLMLSPTLLFPEQMPNAEDYPLNAHPRPGERLQSVYATSTPTPTLATGMPPLEDIVSELEHCVGGGPAMQGNRNGQVYQMARLMRHITGDNPQLLSGIIPPYGLTPEEHRKTIENALRYSQPLPYCPPDLRRAMQRAANQGNGTASDYYTATTPPPLPQHLPESLKCILQATPERARASVAIGAFAALRIHLQGVKFHYTDNTTKEPCFIALCIANQGGLKESIREVINAIIAPVQENDEKSRTLLATWREQCSIMGANKDKPARPSAPIRIMQADCTNAALVQLARNASPHSLYTYAEEVEKLSRMQGLSEIIRSAYDTEKYGQERVASGSVCDVVTLRWSINASTTPQTARQWLKKEMTNGTLTRMTISTIFTPDDDWGEEMPIYGNYGPEYHTHLKPYLDRLAQTHGDITCHEAEDWVEKERLCHINRLREMDAKYLQPFLWRSLKSAFWRACMLYIMEGGKWTQEIADFCSWSLEYDLWCKMHFLGDLIEQACANNIPDNSKRSTNLLSLLPQEFTRDDAQNMRRDMGRDTSSKALRTMLGQWVHCHKIRFDKDREVYVKIPKNNS